MESKQAQRFDRAFRLAQWVEETDEHGFAMYGLRRVEKVYVSHVITMEMQ